MKGQTSVEVMEVSGKGNGSLGMIKTTVPLEKLERVSNNQIKREQASNTRDLIHERKLSFKQDMMCGNEGDEALQAVIYFIDDAISWVLHAYAFCTVRYRRTETIIREYLATEWCGHFADGMWFGGAGITVIDLE